MLPDKNSGWTLTLNVQDKEIIDLAAYRESDVFFTTELGFSEGRVDSCRPWNIYVPIVGSKSWIDPKVEQPALIVKVTSSNAAPHERKIRLHIASTYPTGFRYAGFEFVDGVVEDRS